MQVSVVQFRPWAPSSLYYPAHIARLEKAGEFPKRIQLGACRIAWFEETVEGITPPSSLNEGFRKEQSLGGPTPGLFCLPSNPAGSNR